MSPTRAGLVESVLRVEKPGLLTTIQDLGRPGHRKFGVPPSGAMDRFALAAANRLVGNPEGAAALECALTGPTLLALQPCLVAVTGADFTPTVNGAKIPLWTGVYLPAGGRLSFAGRRSGARCYISVAGGLAASRWLASASTYLLVEKGGFEGRTLEAGDSLGLGAPAPRPLIAGRHLARRLRPDYSREPALDAIVGPHHARLSRASRSVAWKASFEVSRDADRMGFRLEGPQLEVTGSELLSIGLTAGAVQLPIGGQPILLMADHQTAGGYPVILAVTRAALPLAAQLLPGDRLSFREVSVTDAQQRWRAQWLGLDEIA
ncbi:MAG TPA: biotin-dependent carboxyltransferase family protein [Candidatus Dormibacteraeota bacterium]|nr:biotin-dependent carboxyltransferase family protein [Candidatus Dormibacteraeota bacterium]